MQDNRTGSVVAIGQATGFLAVEDGTGCYCVIEVFTSIPIEPGWKLLGDLGTTGSKDLWVERRDESISAIVQFSGLNLPSAMRILNHKA
ncbi:hypothetical protein QYQ99_25560 [Comamonas testosteroni]|uniref:hypothetical protein n=1 Tax=Comamonas testosteroni TaxID=285 RepID=UPI002660166E|nr:hypothetical protein [Comamonas testosteroni]WKL15656.1 hypothetical protein QYQ99_25560 [Comamonas testosteroni]